MRLRHLARPLLAIMLLCGVAYSQIQVAPLVMPRKQFFDANGAPLAGGKVYTYLLNTTTPQVTYTDYTGLVPNANPVILDAGGRASIYINCNQNPFKITVRDSADVLQWSEDGVQYPDCFGATDVEPGDILNTMKNRWASVVWACTTPLGAENAEGVFVDWSWTGITSRTCNDAAYLFPYNTWTTTTTLGDYDHNGTDDASWPLAANPEFSTRQSMGSAASGLRRWIGWTDVAEATMKASDDPAAANLLAFWTCQDSASECGTDSGASTIWCVTKDGTTITRVNSGVTYTNDEIDFFQIKYASATDTATFIIDGSTVCTMNTAMPADSVRMRVNSSITNVAAGTNYSMRGYGIFLYSPLPVP